MDSALNSAFPHVPDKQQAWKDLIKLTADKKSDVRYRATSILGFAFPYMSEKQQAWKDLIKLTTDKDSDVRTYAYHSLGKASVFKASQAEKEEDYRKELEEAIIFFEKSSQEISVLNPSQFCLPFYRSYHTILFLKQETKEGVDKYLVEAKSAIEGSKSKELLIGAVENLAHALKEAQNLENMDLEAKKDELKIYRKYCDHAEEMMKVAYEKAPSATEVLKKGLPILDRNIKMLIEEIKNKAKIACRESIGTDAEGLACEINKEIQNIISYDREKYIEILEDIVSILKLKIPSIPENMFIISKIEAIDKNNSVDKYHDLPLIISMIPTMNIIPEKKLDYKLFKLDLIYDKAISIETKLDLIQKDLEKCFEKLDILSFELGGKEGEIIQQFSKRILELTKKEDKEALKSVLEVMLTNENVLLEEIENSSAPLEDKRNSKNSISKVRSILDNVKNPIRSFGKDVTKEIIVSYAAEEILKLVFQLVSVEAIGFPISPKVLNLLDYMGEQLDK